MSIWVISLLFLLCAKCTESKLKYPPLPKGKAYSLPKVEDNLWSLNGLTSIATGIALTLRSQPPYDIIGNTLSKSFGKGGKSLSISEVIDYEVPLIVLASFSLLAAVVIPIVGLVFCCCRCKGNCGGSIEDSKLKQHPTKERIAYSTGIILCAFFLILAGSFILASSVRMSNSIPHARTVWTESFGDIQIYTGNTLKELNHIVAKEAVPTVGILVDDVIAMGMDIVVPVMQKGSPLFNELFDAVLDLEKAVTQSLYLLTEIQTITSSLVSKSNNIQHELTTAQQNLTDAQDKCKNNGGGGTCNEIPVGNELATEANFTKVPNVTDTHKKVEDVVQTNLTDEVVKGNESVHNIPERVQNLTTNLTNEFQNFSSKIDNMQVDVLQPLEDDINKYLQDTLNPIKDDVDEQYLGPDGMLTKYDKYRHVIFILLGVLTLVDGLLLIIAVMLGLCGSTRYDTPNSRSNVADWGGRLMIGAAGLFFFSAFLINLLAGIVFLLGSNFAIVCEDIDDYKLLQKTVDDPKVMGEYILAQMLFKDGNVPLTISGVLGDCSKNHAPWDVLKMDHLYNLSDVLHYKDQIPAIDEVFGELNKTVEDTTVLSDEAKTSVNDSLDAGVQEINFTQYDEQVKKPIVTVPLPSFASNVSKAANAAKAAGQNAVSDQLMETANRLEQVHTSVVKSAQEQAAKLGQLASDLQHQGDVIMNSVQRTMISLNQVEHFLANEALSIAARGVTKHWDTVFGDVDWLLDHVIRQVRFQVGRCETLSNIYHGLTGSVCHHYAAGMNASWVAFGLCALCLLISIILCVRASKHFLRTKSIGVSDEPGISDDDPLELPCLDGSGLERNHVNLIGIKFSSEI
ncbi:prominin-1-A-like isoform X2 [Oculina patagonica]